MGLLILLSAGLAVLVIAGTFCVVRGMLHPPRRTYAFTLARKLPSDPVELGLIGTETTFNFRDGTRSPAWIFEGRAPDGPVIIITHGWSSGRYPSLNRAALVTRFASRVVLYDMRGHGDSTAPCCRMGTTEVEDLLAIMDQVAEKDRPVVLYGSSMGAGISIAAAARGQDQRIAAVIAEGPYRFLLTPLIAQMKRRKFPTFPFAKLAWWHVRFWLGGFDDYDRAGLAARLRCPLLVLHGEKDDVCDITTSREIASAAADAAFVEIPEAHHSDLAWVDEARYLDAVAALMTRITHVAAEWVTGKSSTPSGVLTAAG